MILIILAKSRMQASYRVNPASSVHVEIYIQQLSD